MVLPGDSLLFIAGAMCATGGMDIGLLIPLLMLASLLGDNTNYCIGRFAGARLFRNPNSKIFRRDHLEHTQTFYQKHGGKTVTIARFMPIIRTFAPFVAGMGHMSWPRFVGFSALGSVLWVGGLVGLGYFFGNVPFIKQNFYQKQLGRHSKMLRRHCKQVGNHSKMLGSHSKHRGNRVKIPHSSHEG